MKKCLAAFLIAVPMCAQVSRGSRHLLGTDGPLTAPSDRLNRVFTIAFPDRATQARFFADVRYREVRATHFEPAVAQSVVLAEFGEEP